MVIRKLFVKNIFFCKCNEITIHLAFQIGITTITKTTSIIITTIMIMMTLGLIVEHFLKFLLKCFLRASEKQRKKKTSDKFMNAWKCVPTQQKCSELNWKRVLVLLNLHTYTPRQLLIRARNRSDVCSQNRENPRESISKATQSTVMSKLKANSGGTQVCKCRPNFTVAEVEVLSQNIDVSILSHYGYIYAIEFSAYLFIHLYLQCS